MKEIKIVFLFIVLSVLVAPNVYSASQNFPNCWGHAMAYVANNTKIIMFGGTNGNNDFDDTWEFDVSNQTWAEVTVNGNSPPATKHHAMTYIGGSMVLLFCDYGTWEYNAISYTWSQISINGNKPPPRSGHAMVYIGGTKALMFGGVGFNDTWVYDSASHSWSEIVVAGSKPIARYGHDAMVYLEDTNKVIMFGGDYYDESCDCGRQLNDTWEYDILNQTWSEVSINGDKPSPREHISMSYAGNNKIVMHGGAYYPDGKYEGGVGQILLDDLWEYDVVSNTWSEISPSGDIPPQLNAHAMEYIDDNTIIMFSGWGTWKYDTQTQTWTEIVQFNGIELSCVQHRKYENDSEYNWLSFVLIDLNGHTYNTLQDIIQSARLYNPEGNEVQLSNLTFYSRKRIYGKYDGNDGRWLYNQEPYYESYYIAQFQTDFIIGTYSLEATDTNGNIFESSFDFSKQVILPIISAKTFQGYFDNAGNFICKWDIPIYLSNELKTSVRAFIKVYNNDTMVADVQVKIPTHLGYFFVPAEIIQMLKSEGDILKFGIQLRTNDNNNRTYSNTVDLDQISIAPIGDINGNGKIGIEEAINALQVVSGLRESKDK